MRGNLVLHLIGETTARQMVKDGVSYAYAESWLLEWEQELSLNVLHGKTCTLVATTLVTLLRDAANITREQGVPANG
jgi:hypothetical protein